MIIIPKGYDGLDILKFNKIRIKTVKSYMTDSEGVDFTIGCIRQLLKNNNKDALKSSMSILFHEDISESAFDDFMLKVKHIDTAIFLIKLSSYYKRQGYKGFTYNIMSILYEMGVR